MARTVSAQDDKPPVDAPLERASEAAAAVDKPIRIRIAPDLYDHTPPAHYSSWSGLSWVIEAEDVGEGKRLREGLDNFLKAFGKSAKSQAAVLKAVAKEAIL